MKLNVRLTLTEEMLGTKAANKDVFADFIASKAPDGDARKEELESAEHREEAGTSIFPCYPVATLRKMGLGYGSRRVIYAPEPERTVTKDGKTIIIPAQPERVVGIYDYQVRGFLKAAATAINRFDKEYRNDMEKLPAYKSKITDCVFVSPRFIPFDFPEGVPLALGVCERPVRAETAQGPRVTVKRSETVPEGTSMDITIDLMSKDLLPWLTLWLDHGRLSGLGEWRNASKGRFVWTEIKP